MIKESSLANKKFDALEGIDQYQPELLIQKSKDFLGTLQGTTIAIFASATRKAVPALPPSEVVIKRHEEEGAIVKTFDPINAAFYLRENDSPHMYETVKDGDALLLMTEILPVQHVNWGKVVDGLKLPLIVDGHNLFLLDEMRKIANTFDLIYCSIRRPNIYKGLGSISVQSVQ